MPKIFANFSSYETKVTYICEKSYYTKHKAGFQAQVRLLMEGNQVDFIPKIDATKCIGCELCVKLCPNHALGFRKNLAVVTNPEACDYAGVCQEICPTEAISLTYEIIFSKR